MRLIAITAPCGVGKSTMVNRLRETDLSETFYLADCDQVGLNWHDYASQPDGGKRYQEEGIAIMVTQSGGKDIVYGGCLNPDSLNHIELDPAISQILFVHLACTDEELTKRLKGRDPARNTHQDDFIASQIDFMNYFRRSGDVLDYVVETTHQSIEETEQAVGDYLRSLMV